MTRPQPKSLYQKILQAEKYTTIQEITDKENSKRIRVHMPCKVVAINGNTVDVEIQGSEDSGYGFYTKFPTLLDLPIIYNNYTSSAYIITPVQIGDTGLVEFLDFNASNFQNDGNTALTSDEYYHSINNGTFINGFIPNSRHIDIPQGYPIVIGLHNKTFTMSIDDSGNLNVNTFGNININSNMEITVNSPSVKFSGNIDVGNGANGSFVSGSGDSITVSGGIIVDIGK